MFHICFVYFCFWVDPAPCSGFLRVPHSIVLPESSWKADFCKVSKLCEKLPAGAFSEVPQKYGKITNLRPGPFPRYQKIQEKYKTLRVLSFS